MSLKQYLSFMSIGTLLCWVAWVFVVYKISPIDSGFIGLFSFYLSLFLAIVGTFSVFGFLVRRVILKNDEIVFKHVKHTFRQSIFLAVLIISFLLMISKDWLYWWNAMILILFFIFVEATFFSVSKDNVGNGLVTK